MGLILFPVKYAAFIFCPDYVADMLMEEPLNLPLMQLWVSRCPYIKPGINAIKRLRVNGITE